MVWLGITAVILVSCGRPQAGGVRGQFVERDGTGGSASAPPDGGARRVTCRDVVCDPNATCSGVGDAARCECLGGFTGDGVVCTDVDECAPGGANDCDAHAACENRPGSFSCRCQDGYLGDGRTCTGVNECDGVESTCDPAAVCVDENPGFSCSCRPGYTGDGFGCADVDECATAGAVACAANAHCVNVRGGSTCACDPGFVGDGNTACRSLCDAARADATVCAAHAACRVDGTAARCDACLPGYSGDGGSCRQASCGAACDGVGTDDADHVACLPDGTCACAPGFEGAVGSCRDVDECAAGGGGCGAHGKCLNVDGGHLCTCQPGYVRDAAGACVDLDECAAAIGPCHPDATCTNRTPEQVPAGYECACKDGFSGDGFVCRDVDECATDRGGCAATAVCVNRRGGFSCECPAPLVGPADSCHCDLSGLWAMRQDVDTCWKARLLQEGTAQDLVSAGSMEATVWELHELRDEGGVVSVRKKGCGADNTPDLISPLFHETYSSYLPLPFFDGASLATGRSFDGATLVPGSTFVTGSEPAVVGLDLGADPLGAAWPASHEAVTTWTDPDGDGEPGVTLWPRLPSEITDSRSSHYSYLPARPGLSATGVYIDQRAGCVSVAARVVTHLEATVESCTRITGQVFNERTEGRVHGCVLVDKGTCDPANLNKCSGWAEDITCTVEDWANGTRCSPEDIDRLDDDQNQAQASVAKFELVRIGDVGAALECPDVRSTLPAIVRRAPTITCTEPP